MDKPVEQYLGIPFAEPPVGKLRFRPPVPKIPWQGTVDATAGNTACPQVAEHAMLKGNLTFTEDCLYLNVWAPVAATDSGPRPVLVWIYGGAFTFGSANSAIYNAVWLAALGDVVVVSMNYRLGILGFMNANSPEAPGNVGLLDQNMALKWVQRNIEHFGGNPELVTLFGESAGSMCTHAHIMSPLSEGLFKRAVMMSGTTYNLDLWDTVQESVAKADKVANVIGCSNATYIELSSSAEEIIDCMRNKSADELFKASFEIAAPKRAPFLPTYHDEFLPRNPLVAMKRGFFSSVDVLAGVNSDEGATYLLFPLVLELLAEDLQDFPREELVQSLRAALWRLLRDGVPDILETYIQEVDPGDNNALRRQYIDHLSDRLFNCPLQFFAEKHSERGNKVFCYVFVHKTTMFPLPAWMGAPHGSDILFTFGHAYAADPDSPDGRMAAAFIRVLVSFSKSGVPEIPNGQTWPLYSESSPNMMLIKNGEFNQTQGFRASYCERWRPLY
ncbi:hypothetical protein HPB52_009340 [Rhipicephalus sanguineus]|uniref:Carboxylic ester hydrolase n=2 Tax=Rhipicephalus sanguineus TaxID=34632 RepID=A0A9D4PFH4_RHISA|nr:hypothetical protein HPB52_009340 [Rhipicephalus sanguineus]